MGQWDGNLENQRLLHNLDLCLSCDRFLAVCFFFFAVPKYASCSFEYFSYRDIDQLRVTTPIQLS